MLSASLGGWGLSGKLIDQLNSPINTDFKSISRAIAKSGKLCLLFHKTEFLFKKSAKLDCRSLCQVAVCTCRNLRSDLVDVIKYLRVLPGQDSTAVNLSHLSFWGGGQCLAGVTWQDRTFRYLTLSIWVKLTLAFDNFSVMQSGGAFWGEGTPNWTCVDFTIKPFSRSRIQYWVVALDGRRGKKVK